MPEWKATDLVCSTCAGANLRPIIDAGGSAQRCISCGKPGKALSVSAIAEEVFEAFARFYEPEYPPPDGQEYQGDHPMEVVRRLIGTDAPTGLDEAITTHLEQREKAGTLRINPRAHYEWSGRGIGGYSFSESWPEFREYVMHRGRYFDPVIDSYLDGVLADIETALGGNDTELPAGTRIYRARLISDAQARDVIDAPRQQLGPAPRGARSGGRLNAPGVAAFYGAFDPQTAVAELRPPVGGLVALGAFETIVPLRILDLTQVSTRHVNLLTPEAVDQVDALDFMKVFHEVITRPALDAGNASYIPTQVLAEYLRREGGFHGLIYRSVQVGRAQSDAANARNIAIFDAEGSVEGTEQGGQKDPYRKLRIPDSETRLRYLEGSLELLRVKAADYLTIGVVDWGDHLIDSDQLHVGGS